VDARDAAPSPRRPRRPAVAGLFYPAEPRSLADTVANLLGAVEPGNAVPKALVAPHAGYVYSGSTAAVAYAQLSGARSAYRRVVLLGPSHRVPFTGIALCSADAYVTPLGPVPTDPRAAETIAHVPTVRMLDAAHVPEHSLEVHLPFLQTLLEGFTLVPLVVGDAPPEHVAAVLEALWDDPETLVVVSTDLSHYLDYDTAVRADRTTTHAIEALDARIRPEQACGCRPLNGLLHLARERGLRVTTLRLCNSGDTAGSRDRVVGYGAYAVA
jgi:AmmeMemoRadiSam system protein B